MSLFVVVDTSAILQPVAVASEVPDDSSLLSSVTVRTILPSKVYTHEDFYDIMFSVAEGSKLGLEECGILRRILT
jgi:hypothetical protein